MRLFPLLHNVYYVALITSDSPVHFRLIHISLSYWTYCLLEIIFKWELFIRLKFKSNGACPNKSIALENIQADMN